MDLTVNFKIMTTHCRNVIFVRKRTLPPVTPPLPPGLVVGLIVVTPGTADSGMATATFTSPDGFLPGTLDYVLTLTGGPGNIDIISVIPQ